MLVSAGMASARTISAEEAQSIATEFVSGSNSGMLKKQGAALQSADLEASHLYGFNIAGGGFVIVSADSRTYQILGYSDSGSLDLANMPESMQAWLQSYDTTIAALGEQPLAEGSEPVSLGAAIDPLIKTTWYQDAPYNDLCPSLPDKTGVDTKCPTGCVATAMAQVMYFHKWPASSPAIPAYTFSYANGDNQATYDMPELPATTFEWDDMLLSYKDITATEAQNAAVAKLMMYCGQSVQMMYGVGGSGAQETAIAQALRHYFNYDLGLYSAKRIFYTADEWEQLIYSELAAGRPVPYAGDTDTSGHSFVCDGYDGAGMFHMNWGWDGKNDGYFSLSVLNPYDNQSIGSSTSRLGFALDQEAVIGVQPPVEGSVQVDNDYYLTLKGNLGVNGINSAIMDVLYESIFGGNKVCAALATIDGDVITPVYTSDSFDILSGYVEFIKLPTDADDFADGTTILYPVARIDDGEHQWQRLASDAYYYEVVKSADSFSVTAYPAPFFDGKYPIPVVAFENPDQQINEPGVINVDFAFDCDYSGAIYYTIFEAGQVGVDDPKFMEVDYMSQNLDYKVWTTGCAVRAGDPIHESISYTPRIPGLLGFSIWRDNSVYPIVTTWDLHVGGTLDFVDIEVVDYEIKTSYEGDVEASFLLRNNDTKTFSVPANSAGGIYIYVEGDEEEHSFTTGTLEPTKELAMQYENFFQFDGIEPGSEMTIVVEERYDLKTIKELFRITFNLGDNLQGAIDTLVDPVTEDNVWYNLQGVRINEPTIPGIYIHNGAKVVIR